LEAVPGGVRRGGNWLGNQVFHVEVKERLGARGDITAD
jgi:hypothetical protein